MSDRAVDLHSHRVAGRDLLHVRRGLIFEELHATVSYFTLSLNV